MSEPDLAELLEGIGEALRDAGLDSEADALDSVTSGAYTSSSEWYGDLGLALVAIRGSVARRASPITLGAIDDALELVREVWPGIG